MCSGRHLKTQEVIESYGIFENQNFSSWLIWNALFLRHQLSSNDYNQWIGRKTVISYFTVCLLPRVGDRIGVGVKNEPSFLGLGRLLHFYTNNKLNIPNGDCLNG